MNAYRSKKRSIWASWETEIINNGTLSECLELLRDRTPAAIKIKWQSLHPTYKRKPAVIHTRIERAQSVDNTWSEEDLNILRENPDLVAKDLRGILNRSRAVWSINKKRRQLNLARPSIGRVSLSPDNYPGTDWSLKTRRIALDLGVCWVTARKLQRLALDKE